MHPSSLKLEAICEVDGECEFDGDVTAVTANQKQVWSTSHDLLPSNQDVCQQNIKRPFYNSGRFCSATLVTHG